MVSCRQRRRACLTGSHSPTALGANRAGRPCNLSFLRRVPDRWNRFFPRHHWPQRHPVADMVAKGVPQKIDLAHDFLLAHSQNLG